MGIDHAFTIYVEEEYDGWIAQHAIRPDGTFLASQDEDHGQKVPDHWLQLPPTAHRPTPPRATLRLNFSGPRHRGLREDERIAEAVRPLSIESRMFIAQRISLPVMPPLLLGLAESYVLAETLFTAPDVYLVCRRLRLAYALPARTGDYDYDTLEVYAAHFYNCSTDDRELPAEQVFTAWPGVTPRRPMDCMIHDNHLLVADGGTNEHPSAIHVWQIEDKL